MRGKERGREGGRVGGGQVERFGTWETGKEDLRRCCGNTLHPTHICCTYVHKPQHYIKAIQYTYPQMSNIRMLSTTAGERLSLGRQQVASTGRRTLLQRTLRRTMR